MAWTPPPQPTIFNVKPEDILFLDIETVPKVKEFDQLDEWGKALFMKKAGEPPQDGNLHLPFYREQWKKTAALHCEFNKIACVTIGVFTQNDEGARIIRLKSVYGFKEDHILKDLAAILAKAKFLLAHNGKRFDFPLLGRKYLQHGLPLPSILNVAGVKPWESSHFDTMEFWGFNDARATVSLDTLTYIFGIESPKANMNGSEVATVYYQESPAELPWEAIKPIATYCEGDVVALMNLLLRLIGQPIIQKDKIVLV